MAVLSALILTAYPVLAQTETLLHSFGPQGFSDGLRPPAGVVFNRHGKLVGTTQNGGESDGGTVFAVTKKGKESVLYSFPGDVASPAAGLVRDKVGNLYGTTENGAVFELTVGGTVTVLYRFGSQPGDGAYPLAGLVLDKQGNLYGTTYYGGAFGLGTVFKLIPGGTETVLYSFGGWSGDGSNPAARLVFDKHGNLYGTTAGGGDVNCFDGYGCGTVFKLTPDGTETVLYRFHGGADGDQPWAGLVLDKKGNLYGTTTAGGGDGCWGNGCGTVFKLTPISAPVIRPVIYRFGTQSGDGTYPAGDLLFDKQGNLYGTTQYGGNFSSCIGNGGCGTVFKLTPSGAETVLYTFNGDPTWGPDGAYPMGWVVFDDKGNLYGTTYEGGAYGQGTVFKLTP